jgi:cytochrome c551/c552
MKSLILAAGALTVIIPAAVALTGIIPAASTDQESLARRNGCLNCHAVKPGSRRMSARSFTELAKAYGDQPDAETTLTKGLVDRTTNHPRIRGTPDETKAIIKWMLTLKPASGS